jgi:hypothetical protein
LHGLPVAFALAGAKASEQEVLLELLAAEPELVAARPGQLLLADKNYFGGQFERLLAASGVRLLRPARKGEPERAGAHLFRPLRQLIESVNQTFKGQLDLERHGGRTPVGVAVRVLQRILALTTCLGGRPRSAARSRPPRRRSRGAWGPPGVGTSASRPRSWSRGQRRRVPPTMRPQGKERRMSNRNVLVLGGNFAGLTAALSLKYALGEGVDVTVVAKSDRFQFNPSFIWIPFGKRKVKDVVFPVAKTFTSPGSSSCTARPPRSTRRPRTWRPPRALTPTTTW